MNLPKVVCTAFLLTTALSAAAELAAVTVPQSEYIEGGAAGEVRRRTVQQAIAISEAFHILVQLVQG